MLEQGGRVEGNLNGDGTMPGVAEIGYHQLHIANTELTLAVAPHQCYTCRCQREDRAKAMGLGDTTLRAAPTRDGGIGDALALSIASPKLPTKARMP